MYVDVQEDATEHVGAVLSRVKHEYLVSRLTLTLQLSHWLACVVPSMVGHDPAMIEFIPINHILPSLDL